MTRRQGTGAQEKEKEADGRAHTTGQEPSGGYGSSGERLGALMVLGKYWILDGYWKGCKVESREMVRVARVRVRVGSRSRYQIEGEDGMYK